MRVTIIAPPHVPVPPPAYGGTEGVLHTLARGLREEGHDVLLVASGDSTCPVPVVSCFPEAVGVGLGGPSPELRHVTFGYRQAEDWGADVVHDHTLIGPLYSVCGTVLPVVTTNHGPFEAPELGSLYRALAGEVGIIAISHHQASTAPPGTAIDAVVHHGIEVGADGPGPGDGGFALFLGRMHPSKGVDRAITVARRARVPLVIAAKMREPAEIAYFEQQVEPMLGPGVAFVGEVGVERRAQLLRRAVALLNPVAWHEPFGMVMIEALAAGTPVVATPMGSVPEIVDHGETGFVGGTDAELVSGLRAAADLDRQACHRAAATRFSAARMVRDHVEVYLRVAAGRLAGAQLG